jgi:hypothetical protein
VGVMMKYRCFFLFALFAALLVVITVSCDNSVIKDWYEGGNADVESKGAISPFQFSPTNGLLEGHINTKAGAVAGVFSDPNTGEYPFTYNIESYQDIFELETDTDGNVLLKIKATLAAKNPWSVSVKVSDSAGNFYKGPAVFTVNLMGTSNPITSDFEFVRAPGGFWIHSLGGSIAGTFTAPSDKSGTAPFSYELAAGNGDDDNDCFEIVNDGNALSIKANAVLSAAANPYNICVKITDSLGYSRLQAFEFNLGVARVVITNHPQGTRAYSTKLFSSALDAENFTSAASAISEGDTISRSTLADIIVHGNIKPSENEGASYSLLLRDEASGYVGYFNGITFTDGAASVSWDDIWHTFTTAQSFSDFMASPDTKTDPEKPYNIALSGISMTNDLSAGKTYELYSRMRSDVDYVFDFRGCTGASFTSAAEHPNAARIKEVYLGSNLETVGDYAFDGCVNLTTTLPKNIEQIGDYAFQNCAKLDVSFDDCNNLTTIGNAAFSNCSTLAKTQQVLDFSDCTKLKTMGNSAFYNCDNIVSVNLSNTKLETLATSLFSSCDILESVDLTPITDTLTSIGNSAFSACQKLKTVNLSLCTKLESIGSSAFYNCIQFTEAVDFSTNSNGTLTTIGNSAFESSGITSINILNCKTLSSIGSGAFYGSKIQNADLSFCTALTSIALATFSNCPDLTTVKFVNCTALTTIESGSSSSGVSTSGAFAKSEKLITLFLSDTKISSIGDYAFSNCTSIDSFDWQGVGTTLQSIGSYAFQYSGLSQAVISVCTSLTSIDQYAFYYCDYLDSINLPSSVTSVGNYAFAQCSTLSSIYLYMTEPTAAMFPGANTFSDIKNGFTLFVPYDSKTVYQNFWASKTQWRQPGSIL